METHLNTVVRFNPSTMILCANTNTSYLSDPQACSHTSGYFFLGIVTSKCVQECFNDQVHWNCNILILVAAYISDAETGGCLVMVIYVIILRNTLEEIGHTQPIEKLCRYKKTASGIDNDAIKQQRSWAMNMRYFSILYQKNLLKLSHCMGISTENIVVYLMKHNYSKNHKHVSLIYLHTNKTLRSVPLVLTKPSLNIPI